MAKKSNQPKSGSITYGFISPEGIGYPIVDGNYHAQWIFENYDFIKSRYPDFPGMDKLKFLMVEDIRYELVGRGWIGVGMDFIVYVRDLKRQKQDVIDAILTGAIILPHKTSPVRILDYSRDAFKTHPYTYEELEEYGGVYGSFKGFKKISMRVPLLYKISDVTQGSGFWILPDNKMQSLKSSHIEWLRDNTDTLGKYFDITNIKDPGALFLTAFQNGFVRFRTEYDDDDPNFPDGKIVSSISADSIDRIKNLPNMAKSMIAYSNEIHFFDMSNNAQMTVIPEDEIPNYTGYSSPDKRTISNVKILLKLAKLKDADAPIAAPKAEDIVDKGWISPDGTSYNTFHTFHAGWIAEHFDWINDRIPLGNKQDVATKSEDPSCALDLRQFLIRHGWVAVYTAFNSVQFYTNGDSRSLKNAEEAVLLRQVPREPVYQVWNINNGSDHKYSIEEIQESGMAKMASEHKKIKLSQLDKQTSNCNYVSAELDLIHEQSKFDENEVLKLFFILDHILRKSDIGADVHAKVLNKYKQLKDAINFDQYSQEWLNKKSQMDTSDINKVLQLIG